MAVAETTSVLGCLVRSIQIGLEAWALFGLGEVTSLGPYIVYRAGWNRGSALLCFAAICASEAGWRGDWNMCIAAVLLPTCELLPTRGDLVETAATIGCRCTACCAVFMSGL